MRPAVPPKLIAERFTLCRPLSASTITLGLRFGLMMGASSLRIHHSPERLERELQLVSVGREFQPYFRASLAASASLLSSIIAFEILCL